MKPLRPTEARSLDPHHRWKATPGYRIFVADRGALRLDFPDGWVWSQDQDSFKFRDREPPDDRCTLAVSLWRVGGGTAAAVPLAQLANGVLGVDRRKPVSRSELVEERRGGLALAWVEMRFLDTNEGREAVARWCFARERGLQAMLSLDFWPEDAVWVDPVWRDALASLELDRAIADPTFGPAVH